MPVQTGPEPPDDRFMLSNTIFPAFEVTKGPIQPDQLRVNLTGVAQESPDRIACDLYSDGVFYDADRVGGADAVQRATIATDLTLTAADLLLAWDSDSVVGLGRLPAINSRLKSCGRRVTHE